MRISYGFLKSIGAFTITLLTAAFLSACGSSKNGNSFSSTGVTYLPGATNSKLAECVRIGASSTGLAGQIGTYYDPLSHVYRSDYTNVNLTATPSTIFTSSTVTIYFMRWSEKSAGNRVNNSVYTRFYFVDKLTGQTYPNGTTLDRITKANLEQARTYFAWTSSVTLEQFFQRASLVLTGVDMNYDAITIALLDSSFSSAAYAQVDVLLPPVYSNPVTYQARNPVPDLYTLHPNYASIASNASENDFYQMAQVICSELAGIGVRIPASVDSAASGITKAGTTASASTAAAKSGAHAASWPRPTDQATAARGTAAEKSPDSLSFFGRIWHRILDSFEDMRI